MAPCALHPCQPPPLRTAPGVACKALLPSKAHRTQTAAPEQTQGLRGAESIPQSHLVARRPQAGARGRPPSAAMHALPTPTPRLPPLAFPALCQSGGDDLCCLDGTQLFPGALFPHSEGWAFAQQVEDTLGQMYRDQEGAVASLMTGSSDPGTVLGTTVLTLQIAGRPEVVLLLPESVIL